MPAETLNRLMRSFVVLLLTLFFHALCVCGQTDSIPDSSSPDRSIHLLREDEDWSFLADPALRQDFWDPLKYIRLRDGHNDWYLTVSGEAREVWEQIGNATGPKPELLGPLGWLQILRRSLMSAADVLLKPEECCAVVVANGGGYGMGLAYAREMIHPA